MLYNQVGGRCCYISKVSDNNKIIKDNDDNNTQIKENYYIAYLSLILKFIEKL